MQLCESWNEIVQNGKKNAVFILRDWYGISATFKNCKTEFATKVELQKLATFSRCLAPLQIKY